MSDGGAASVTVPTPGSEDQTHASVGGTGNIRAIRGTRGTGVAAETVPATGRTSIEGKEGITPESGEGTDSSFRSETSGTISGRLAAPRE